MDYADRINFYVMDAVSFFRNPSPNLRGNASLLVGMLAACPSVAHPKEYRGRGHHVHTCMKCLHVYVGIRVCDVCICVYVTLYDVRNC